MNSISHYLAKLRATPTDQIAAKISARLARELRNAPRRLRDRLRGTYQLEMDRSPRLGRCFVFDGIPAARQTVDAAWVKDLTDRYLEHSFDLLGSGWVRVRHGMLCRGLEGISYRMGGQLTPDRQGRWLSGRIDRANLGQARRIWSLIDEGYVPLDWHLDFKSGYRWPEHRWYRDVSYGHQPGADIKVPWELARMQHLPQLAWAYALAKDGVPGFHPPESYLREYRNQVLDFIASNPPRFGVNWSCTMEVGIRLVNWLITFDLFRGFGAGFDAEFEAILARSTYEHGRHCRENLEWQEGFRSNHYLSDLAGLLFAAAYLPQSANTDGWLRFALQELVSEMAHEFHDDGSNFEASTSYHRLSTEIMLYCALLCRVLPAGRRQGLAAPAGSGAEQGAPRAAAELLPSWFWERLERAVEFTLHITKPDGTVPQFGDNDSGRFLKMSPVYRSLDPARAAELYHNLEGYRAETGGCYLDEEVLDHRHLLGLASVLFERPDFQTAATGTLEVAFAAAVLGERRGASYHSAGGGAGGCPGSAGAGTFLADTPAARPSGPIGAAVSVQGQAPLILSYPGFGLYLYRCERLYLAIRCGSLGQNGHGGHAHNDQLSFELCLDGASVFVDTGSYLYTPLPQRRNEYRATAAHNTVHIAGTEQYAWQPGASGLFRLQGGAPGSCATWQAGSDAALFSGELESGSYRHRREIQVASTQRSLRVVDQVTCTGRPGAQRFVLHTTLKPALLGDTVTLGQLRVVARGAQWEVEPYRLSNKYGSLVTSSRLSALFTGSSIEVEFSYE